jgi:hypothetical protein
MLKLIAVSGALWLSYCEYIEFSGIRRFGLDILCAVTLCGRCD